MRLETSILNDFDVEGFMVVCIVYHAKAVTARAGKIELPRCRQRAKAASPEGSWMCRPARPRRA